MFRRENRRERIKCAVSINTSCILQRVRDTTIERMRTPERIRELAQRDRRRLAACEVTHNDEIEGGRAVLSFGMRSG